MRKTIHEIAEMLGLSRRGFQHFLLRNKIDVNPIRIGYLKHYSREDVAKIVAAHDREKPKKAPAGWVTVEELSQIVHRNQSIIRKHMAKGKIPKQSLQCGQRKYWSPQDTQIIKDYFTPKPRNGKPKAKNPETMQPPEGYLSLQDVADMVAFHRSYICKLIANGKIPKQSVRYGRRKYWSPQDVKIIKQYFRTHQRTIRVQSVNCEPKPKVEKTYRNRLVIPPKPQDDPRLAELDRQLRAVELTLGLK